MRSRLQALQARYDLISQQRMSELREFYQRRADEFLEASRNLHAELDKNKPMKALDARA